MRRSQRSIVPAFTIVELLVVMGIIAILFSAIFVASATVLSRARTTATGAVLQVVSEALEEFKREQPGITKASRVTTNTGTSQTYRYRDRYGDYPPDELEVFTQVGLPGWDLPPVGNRTLAPSSAIVAPDKLSPSSTPWGAMRFYRQPDADKNAIEHRDIAAMVLAIDLYGNTSKSILDNIPAKNWRNAPLDSSGKNPAIWLDRPVPGGTPDNQFGTEDLQIRYVVDDWGTPLSYFAQRDWSSTETTAISENRASTNHPNWREASSTFVRLNGGLPVIMSYGPDGQDQLKEEPMISLPSGESGSADALATLAGDFGLYPDSSADRKINHPMNDDNVYVNPDLREKLAKGQ